MSLVSSRKNAKDRKPSCNPCNLRPAHRISEGYLKRLVPSDGLCAPSAAAKVLSVQVFPLSGLMKCLVCLISCFLEFIGIRQFRRRKA